MKIISSFLYFLI